MIGQAWVWDLSLGEQGIVIGQIIGTVQNKILNKIFVQIFEQNQNILFKFYSLQF